MLEDCREMETKEVGERWRIRVKVCSCVHVSKVGSLLVEDSLIMLLCLDGALAEHPLLPCSSSEMSCDVEISFTTER